MKIDNSYNNQNIYNTNNSNNYGDVSKIKFHNMLAELLGSSNEEENSDSDQTTLDKNGAIEMIPMGRFMPPPPPPPQGGNALDLEAIIDEALANGKITAEKAEEYKALLSSMSEEQADGASAAQLMQIFQILQAYLSMPAEEDSEAVSAIASREEIETKRLTDLSAAVEKAKEAGELTDEQYTLITEFIANQQNFLAMMIDLRPEKPEETLTSVDESSESTVS